jgi:hypothetical protein
VNADLQSTIWYTGSTIAQTLSGSIGLLGAIMLFALQETTRSIQRAAKQLCDIPHPTMNPHIIRHLLTRRSYREIARIYGDQLSSESAETNVELLVHHSTLTWELDHDQLLRRSVWQALVASGIVISFAIACTALATQLSNQPGLGWPMLYVLMAGAVGCLILYGFLLRALFHGGAETKEVKVAGGSR